MSTDFVDPAGDLQAEGGGNRMLTMCTTSHNHHAARQGRPGRHDTTQLGHFLGSSPRFPVRA